MSNERPAAAARCLTGTSVPGKHGDTRNRRPKPATVALPAKIREAGLEGAPGGPAPATRPPRRGPEPTMPSPAGPVATRPRRPGALPIPCSGPGPRGICRRRVRRGLIPIEGINPSARKSPRGALDPTRRDGTGTRAPAEDPFLFAAWIGYASRGCCAATPSKGPKAMRQEGPLNLPIADELRGLDPARPLAPGPGPFPTPW